MQLLSHLRKKIITKNIYFNNSTTSFWAVTLLCLFLACSAQNCSHQIGDWRTRLEIPQFHIEGPFITANDKLYVFTGFQTNDLVCENTMEVFDPQQNSWTSLAATPVNVSHVQAAAFDGMYV